MPILQIRDENGNFIPINAIKGEDGKSAYEQAVEGGYLGTEEEFVAFLNGALNPVSVIGDEPSHIDDKNNPHSVTAEQTGAIPEAYSSTNDLNAELQQGGGKMKVCCYNEFTQNTPYTEGLTDCTHGMVITNAFTPDYSTQICTPSGEDSIYIRRVNGSGISRWGKMANKEEVNNLQSQMVGWGELLPKLARAASGSYTGTNEHGTNKPNKLTFDFIPLFVMVSRRGDASISSGNTFIWMYPNSTLNFINNGSSYWCHTTLDGTTLSWYNAESASYQLNSSGFTYDYVSWGLQI